MDSVRCLQDITPAPVIPPRTLSAGDGMWRLVTGALRDVRRAPPAPATPRLMLLGALAVGLCFALFYQLGVPLRSTYGARVNVDEPFYLLTTVSLLRDRDLDLANDYALQRYREFFDGPDDLWSQSSPTAAGRILSPHNVGLPVLLMLPYAVGGVDGAKAVLGLLGGATIALAALLAYRATGHARAALIGSALIGSAAPVFVYATQVYPEMPAAFLVTAAAWLLLGAAPGAGAAVGLALALSGLVWLGTKYALVGGMLGALALVRLRGRGRAILVGLLVPGGAAYVWFHLATYGGLTPYGVNRLYAGHDTPSLIWLHAALWDRLYRFAGLWVDGEFGLVRWAPALLLVLPVAIPLALRRGPVRWVWLPVFGTQLLVAVFLSITMRGWWFPGRMLICVLPLLAIPITEALAHAARRPWLLVPATTLGLYTTVVTVMFAVAGRAGQITVAVDPFDLAWPGFHQLASLFPVYSAYTMHTWGLTAAWGLVAAVLLAAPYLPALPGRQPTGLPGKTVAPRPAV